jgi:hypothetical protein
MIKLPGSELENLLDFDEKKITLINIGGDAHDFVCKDFHQQKVRRIFACRFNGISAISSRNRVPPLHTSK